MEPFAYKKPQSSGNRKLIGLVLAMMLAVWYFDIIPEVGTVPTGGLDSEVLNPNLNDADFLAMLDALPADDIADNTNASSLPQKTEDDPLQAALASQVDPLEEVFPEFAEPPLPVPTKSSANPNQTQAVTGGIQQAVFAPAKTPRREPAIVQTVLSPEVAATLRNADQWVTNGETLEAHAALSRLYWKQPEFRAQI
ncbi:MAG: hypothetical protein ABGZ24_26155, partial [Fuerstiella sp.]